MENNMKTSENILINMGSLNDHNIYYNSKDQKVYATKPVGVNYSAIIAPIAIFLLQRLSKLLNQSFGNVSSPLNLLFFIFMSLFLVFGTLFLAKSSRRKIKTETFKVVQLTQSDLNTLWRKIKWDVALEFICLSMILFSSYRYLTFSDFQFLIIYMLSIFAFTYMVYEFQLKQRKKIIKMLSQDFN